MEHSAGALPNGFIVDQRVPAKHNINKNCRHKLTVECAMISALCQVLVVTCLNILNVSHLWVQHVCVSLCSGSGNNVPCVSKDSLVIQMCAVIIYNHTNSSRGGWVGKGPKSWTLAQRCFFIL